MKPSQGRRLHSLHSGLRGTSRWTCSMAQVHRLHSDGLLPAAAAQRPTRELKIAAEATGRAQHCASLKGGADPTAGVPGRSSLHTHTQSLKKLWRTAANNCTSRLQECTKTIIMESDYVSVCVSSLFVQVCSNKIHGSTCSCIIAIEISLIHLCIMYIHLSLD